MRGAAAVLICTAAISAFFCGRGMILSDAKEGGAENEVTAFVTSYYEAQTPEKVETLADYVADPEELDFQMFLVNLQVLFAHGFLYQEDLRIAAYPLSDDRHWLVPVSGEWVIRDFDVAVPGMKMLLVGMNPDGELRIESYGDEELDDALLGEVRKISLSDEVIDWNNEIAQKYNDVIADYPDVAEWVFAVADEAGQAKAEAMQKIMDGEENADKNASGEASDGRSARYVVKEGDCLWRIAKEWLGDGMRWNQLYEANRAVIGENPDLLYVGIELQL